MALAALPASTGWRWWKLSWRLVSSHGNLATISLLFVLLSGLLTLIPGIGVIMNIASPALLAGMFAIFRASDRGERLSIQTFLAPAREHTRSFLLLGIFMLFTYLVSSIIATFATARIFGDTALQSLQNILTSLTTGQRIDPDTPEFVTAVYALYTFLSLKFFMLIPVLAAFWYTPFLIAWQDQSVKKSLILSFFVVIKNFSAFLINSLVGTLAISAFLILTKLALSSTQAIIPPQIGAWIAILLIIIMIGLMPVFLYANWYFSYKTVFEKEAQ